MNTKKKSLGKRIWENIVADYILIFAVIVLIIILSLMVEQFLTMTNIMNVLRQMSMVAIIAVGIFFVMVGGGIDISVGSIVGLITVVMATGISKMGINPVVVIFISLAVGALCGAFNGLLIAKIGVPALIGTLGTMEVIRGLLYVFTNGYTVGLVEESIKFIGKGYVWFIPFPAVVMIIIYIAGHFISQKTAFGRYVYAVGGNDEASYLSGIKITRVRMITYTISGVTAAISGIILSLRLSSGQPAAAIGWEFEAITAALIGGVSIIGGKGKVFGVLLGIILISLLTNGMTMLDLNSYWQRVIKGVVLIVAIVLDVYKTKKQSKN